MEGSTYSMFLWWIFEEQLNSVDHSTLSYARVDSQVMVG